MIYQIIDNRIRKIRNDAGLYNYTSANLDFTVFAEVEWATKRRLIHPTIIKDFIKNQ